MGHWNLNGVVSRQFGNKLDLDVVKNTISKYDIFGVSETHLPPQNGKNIDTFRDFHSYRSPGKRQNDSSGGLSVYIKKDIMQGISIIHDETPDFMWIEMDKRFFNLEDNIYIGFVYISPINSNLNVNQECQSFESLEKDICKFKSKGNVMLLGDFNSRTCNLPDFIVNDGDKHTPVPDVYISDEFESLQARRNEDISPPNAYGKRLIDLCREMELRFLNGRVMGDLSGKLTCYKWNGCSAVDYAVVQKDIFRNVDFFKVHDLMGHISDHCLISVGLKCKFYRHLLDSQCIYDLRPKYKWNNQSEFIYKAAMQSSEISAKIEQFLDVTNGTDVEKMTESVCDILHSAAKSTLKQNKSS